MYITNNVYSGALRSNNEITLITVTNEFKYYFGIILQHKKNDQFILKIFKSIEAFIKTIEKENR